MQPTLQSTNGFPLKAYLKLYSRHRRALYLNYFEDFKLLVAFLGPVAPLSGKVAPAIPWYERTYEVEELAKILKVRPELVQATLKELDHG